MKYIITGDWHLRADKPRCRLDENWLQTQRLAVRNIVDYSNIHECDIIFTGDLFHTPVVPPNVTNMLIQELSLLENDFLLIAGNHDCQYHNIGNIFKSSFGTILANGLSNGGSGIVDLPLYVLPAISGFHFGQEPEEKDIKKEMIVIHRLVFNFQKHKFPGATGIMTDELLKLYPNVKWILTGDNHRNFHYENDGRHVVNPGTLLRQHANEIGYETGFYVIDGDDIEFVRVQDDENLVTDEYLRSENEKSDRIEAFIESVKNTGEISLDFLSNLREFMKNNDLGPASDVINNFMEDLNESWS